ncbi:MAG: hypothetical protein N4A33_12250 [Bacteriovoracaceae bacterium]|jgi:hypothetical protein|nr:hypothetical protein [Bacteriovoracaceae bacterium]
MNNIDRLLEFDAFDFSQEAKEAFTKSLRECAQIHLESNPLLCKLYDDEKFDPSCLDSFKDVTRLPFLMVNTFKENNFITGSSEDIVLELGSSGTSGVRSVMRLNQESLDRVKLIAKKIYHELGITSEKKYNYLCFTYDPVVAGDVGTAFTDELLTSFTQKNEVYYSFEFDEKKNDFIYDQKKTASKLLEFSKSEYPLRILGFPAFLYKLLKDEKINVHLGDDSWVQIGGGWKDKENERIDKSSFREFVANRLGIPKENVRDLFGMVEHGVAYVDCDKGKLRVPNFSRVIIRDPFTLRALGYGQKGLMQLICTYNTSYPSFSILTSDYAILHEDLDGKGESIEILGRAKNKNFKTCAIKANELME